MSIDLGDFYAPDVIAGLRYPMIVVYYQDGISGCVQSFDISNQQGNKIVWELFLVHFLPAVPCEVIRINSSMYWKLERLS